MINCFRTGLQIPPVPGHTKPLSDQTPWLDHFPADREWSCKGFWELSKKGPSKKVEKARKQKILKREEKALIRGFWDNSINSHSFFEFS